jgi:uncharacterized protein YyaL (SSP411 family)
MQTATPNRLANEKSPYLLQHAHNPVDWFPWGEAAWEKARAEDKPIFLSIGYSTCHWCHVMAHESFENEETAALLNEHFVPVKVDREERPDVDRMYMTFVQATTGSGGWPMSVWLTPDLKPFVGGTYYPPTDRYGRPGFSTVLRHLADAWKNDRQRILAHGEKIVSALTEYVTAGSAPAGLPDRSAIENAFTQIAQSFDPNLGGFSGAPKFPRPALLNLLFRCHEGAIDGRGPHEQALHMAQWTLRKMAAGGMHDHLGGGFHRYSVDAEWHIPHFEKMLYDQAQLAIAYLEAFEITGDPFFEQVARDIFSYVLRDLRDPAGGFYSAEDADSLLEHGRPEHGEGAFYVWRHEEISEALGSEAAAIFNRCYGVEPEGNATPAGDPHGELRGTNTLIRRHDTPALAKFFGKKESEIDASLAQSRALLLERRAKRPRPHLDDKIITSWNGLMISAFARAAQILNDPTYYDAASAAAQFIRDHLWRPDSNVLIRSYRQGPSAVEGFADDYAFLIQGLIDLYETRGDFSHLDWAMELQTAMDARFFDSNAGGYFGSTDRDRSILIRMKEDHDGAEPAPSSIAALNLIRLADITGQQAFRERAEHTIRAFHLQLTRMPTALPQMLVALDFLSADRAQIIVAAREPAGPAAAPLLREIHRPFLPHRVVIFADGATGQQRLAPTLPFLPTPPPDGAEVFICKNYTCQLPTRDPATIRALLAQPHK